MRGVQYYRIIQDGVPVAWAEGPRAAQEIAHYALVYAQDGPVTVQQYQPGGRWRNTAPKKGE